jgi:hypothetical protein
MKSLPKNMNERNNMALTYAFTNGHWLLLSELTGQWSTEALYDDSAMSRARLIALPPPTRATRP